MTPCPTYCEALHKSILASQTADPALYRQAAALYRALNMPCSADAMDRRAAHYEETNARQIEFMEVT